MPSSKITTKSLLIISFIIATTSLSSCSWMPSFRFPGVYKISIQQGNMVDQKTIDKLRAGMTKKQVKFVMGTSLLVDTFNQNRWDYFYNKKTGKGKTTQKKISLFFSNNMLDSYHGDITPANFNVVTKPITNEENANNPENSKQTDSISI